MSIHKLEMLTKLDTQYLTVKYVLGSLTKKGYWSCVMSI